MAGARRKRHIVVRMMRWLARLVLWTIGLVSAVALTMLIILQTDWGRERLKRIILGAASGVIDGELKIDKLIVELDGKIVLEGVSLRSHDVDVLAVRRLEIGCLWVPLVAKHLAITDARVEGLRFQAPVGPLMKPSPEPPPGPKGPPSAMSFSLLHLELVDAQVTLPDGTQITGDATVAAHASLPGDKGPSMHVILHPSRLTVRGEKLRLQGEAELENGVLDVRGVEISGTGAKLNVSAARYSLVDGSVTASVYLFARADVVNRLVPKLAMLGDVKLQAGVARASATSPFVAWLGGVAAGTELELTAAVPPSLVGIEGTLQFGGLAPQIIDSRIPRGKLSGSVTIHDFDANVLDGKVDLLVSGDLGELDVDTLSVHGERRGEKLSGRVALRTNQGSAKIDAFVRVPKDPNAKIVIDEAHVTGTLPDVGPLVARFAPDKKVSGAAKDVNLTVAGTLDDLAVNGGLTLDHPGAEGEGASSVVVTADLRGLPSAIHGKATVTAQAIGVPGAPAPQVGSVTVSAVRKKPNDPIDVTIDVGGAGPLAEGHVHGMVAIGGKNVVAVELLDERLKTDDVVWTGETGSIAYGVDGAVTAHDVALTSDLGSVIVSGRLDPKEQRTTKGKHNEEGSLALQLTSIDLGRVEALFMPDKLSSLPLAGTADVAARISRHGRQLAVRIDGGVSGFAWREGMAPVDVSYELDLSDGRAEGTISIDDNAGTIAVDFAANAPVDPTDVAAWKKLTPDDMRHAKVVLAKLDLAHVAELAGMEGALIGVLDGTLELPQHRGHIDQLDVDLALTGYGRPEWSAPFDAKVTATWTASSATGLVLVSTGGAEIARVDARVGVAALDLWKRRQEALLDAPAHVQIGVEKASLKLLQQLGLLKMKTLDGDAEGSIALDGTLRNPSASAHLNVTDLKLASARIKKIMLDGEGTRDGGQLTLTATGDDPKEQLDLHASLDRRGDTFGVDAAVKLHRLDLGFLRGFARDSISPLSAASGTLDADVAIGGTLAAPSGHASLVLTDGKFLLGDDMERFDKTNLEAALDQGVITISKLNAQSGNGTLAAHGVMRLAEPAGLDVDLSTERFSFLAGANILELTTRLNLTVKREGSAWEGVATLRGTTVNMARSRAQALQSLSALADVHFVDAKAARLAAAEEVRAQPPPEREAGTHVHIKTPDEIHVVGPDLIDASVTTSDLLAELVNGHVVIFGDVDVSSGQVTFNDRNWDIRKAHASFDGTFPVDAAIDVDIAHDFDAATMDVAMQGSLRHLGTPELSSSPPIWDTQEMLSILMGNDPEDSSTGNSASSAANAAGGAAIGIAANQALGPLKNLIREVLPLDVLRVTVENGDSGDYQYGVETGGHLGKSFQYLVHYRGQSTVTTTLENSWDVTGDWTFYKHWLLEGKAGDMYQSLDLLWSFRK